VKQFVESFAMYKYVQMSLRNETFIKIVIKQIPWRSTVHCAIRIRLNCMAREGLSYLRTLLIMDDNNSSSQRKKMRLVSRNRPHELFN